MPRILPTQNAIKVRAFDVTFLECPPIFDAFHAKSNMNAAPNVPDRKEAASKPDLLIGFPPGSRPIMSPAAIIVGVMQMNITRDRSCHLSER